MPSDRTEHQSPEELQQARDLSLESTRPPAQIPGYKLDQFIGSGAYGEVWSAIDSKTGRRVAVKFYTRRSNQDVQLLAQEVQKLVVLSNDSYVVGLLDVGWDASPPYYVMDYIESGSLEDRLKDGTSMPTAEAVELFQEIATGMVLLHGKGILHCDLKPGNVLLDQKGKPRVADFGQARLKTDETPALGTLFYMAPEQADMEAIPDAGWDVYGLGALLFSMLTGKPPYYTPKLAKTIESSEDIGDRLAKYRETLMAAPRPTEHRQIPGVDRGLADIIDKCIAADPKKRFSNVQSVLLALRQRELVRARRPLMWLGLIAPILLMAVVSMFGKWAFDRAMEETKDAVTKKAQESNFSAAKFAARSAEKQVEEFSRVVRQLARDETFLAAFDKIIADQELKKVRIQVADPTLNSKHGVEQGPEIAKLRAALKAHQPREEFQKVFLKSRMQDKDNEYPLAASWFVSDRYGNQIASDFGDEENLTLGCNYSYRTYFTGEDDDLDLNDNRISHFVLDDETLSSRPIISKPHLSAVFKSQQSKTWKVAFSAPIFCKGKVGVQGIVAATVNLGNLTEFQNNKMQYVMLVDNRFKGRAKILHHPLFAQVLSEQIEEKQTEAAVLPEALANKVFDLSDVELSDPDSSQPNSFDKEFDFEDPLGKTPEGERLGYNGKRIVSRIKVNAGRLGEGEQKTELEVLALHNYQNILIDVTNLGKRLGWLAAQAGLVVLCLLLAMLLFVNRMMRESRERLARAFSPSMDSSAFQSMETVAAVSESGNATRRPPNNRTKDH